MMRALCAGAALLALAGCGAQGGASYATVVADTRAAYTVTEGLVNAAIAQGVIPASQAAIIQTAEGKADPVVAALGATTSPDTVAAVLADAQALAAALPAGKITSDVQQALFVATVGFQAYQAAQGAQVAAH